MCALVQVGGAVCASKKSVKCSQCRVSVTSIKLSLCISQSLCFPLCQSFVCSCAIVDGVVCHIKTPGNIGVGCNCASTLGMKPNCAGSPCGRRWPPTLFVVGVDESIFSIERDLCTSGRLYHSSGCVWSVCTATERVAEVEMCGIADYSIGRQWATTTEMQQTPAAYAT